MIAIVTGECNILILQKYGFKVCAISFSFYSIYFEVYIYSLCNNTQQRATSPFYDTPVISSSDHKKTEPYQVSANLCEGYRNSDLVCMLQQSHAIYYCNQSVLEIVPDLNIFLFSITIVDIILRSSLVRL